MFTLLFEILDPPDPTPRKRYLFCNDNRHPRRVTGCEYIHARNLAALLSHPEIHRHRDRLRHRHRGLHRHRDRHAEPRDPDQRTPAAL